ncbi:hypothetical protein QYE76_019089 [Lolium multiflorum]|uniref:Uncharacterized protein n=1 Tax=Lolium multiflorum TaxID=4521 RepID=A0AAD8R4B3_LOLMU|nr:hypothetical protein QYE76_019089 [Lolium multiflorum]
MDDLIHRAAAPRAAIKGGPPLSNPSHHQLPLSSLTLLDHIPLHISHRRSPIARRSTMEPPQKEKKIAAAPGDATCTRRTAIVDNVAAHLADHRRSTGELFDPLPTPPVSSRLAGDDDAPPGFKIKNLLKLTIYGFQPDENMVRYVRITREVAVNMKEILLHDRKACERCGDLDPKTKVITRSRVYPNNSVVKTRAGRRPGGLYIDEPAAAPGAATAQPQEEDDPELQAALAASRELNDLEELAKWPHLVEAMCASALEESRGVGVPRHGAPAGGGHAPGRAPARGGAVGRCGEVAAEGGGAAGTTAQDGEPSGPALRTGKGGGPWPESPAPSGMSSGTARRRGVLIDGDDDEYYWE